MIGCTWMIEYTEQIHCIMVEYEGLIEVDEDDYDEDDDITKVFVIDGGMF